MFYVDVRKKNQRILSYALFSNCFFITEMASVYCAVGTGALNIVLKRLS